MVNFSFQGGLYSRGLNIQAAFSATDHIGLFLNYHHYGAFYTNDAILVSTSGDGHFRGNFGEAGIGYFFTFHEKWIFETYGGMGLGNVQNEKTDDSYYFNMPYRSAKVRYHRYFVQPAIGWVLNEHFELAVSSRLCLLNYKDVSIGSGDDMDIYQLTGIENNPLFLFEPAFTLRVGGKNVKFQYQLSYSENFGNHEENFDPFGVSFAVFFKIHGKKK